MKSAKDKLAKIEEEYGKDSKQYKKAERAVNSYGAKDVDNGVFIFSREGDGAGRVGTNGYRVPKTKDNPNGQRIIVGIDPSSFSGDNFDHLIAHEGSHVADGSDWVASGFTDAKNPTNYQTEFDGYYVQALMAEAKGAAYSQVETKLQLPYKPYRKMRLPTQIWNSSWAPADVETLRTNNVNTHLRLDTDYKLKPDDKTKAFDRRGRFQ